jgi:hypothetical protein
MSTSRLAFVVNPQHTIHHGFPPKAETPDDYVLAAIGRPRTQSPKPKWAPPQKSLSAAVVQVERRYAFPVKICDFVVGKPPVRSVEYEPS